MDEPDFRNRVVHLLSPMNPKKLYFKLLQAVHHAEVIDLAQSSGVFPAGMYKQVQKVTSFTKPSPNAETTARVKENTDQWMLVNMNILKLHYDQIIARGIQDLPPFNLAASEKAIGFGKTRYRDKLTATSISTTLIKTNAQTLSESGQENINLNVAQCPEEWPELGQPGDPESTNGARF